MKFLKGVGLFFIYPLIMLCIGFFSGILTYEYFYPGTKEPVRQYSEKTNITEQDYRQVQDAPKQNAEMSDNDNPSQELLSASSVEEILNADTKYILQEMDVLNQTVVEIEDRVPSLYLGMDREQFLLAMEQYEAFPPLAEMERGFIGLEVLSFSSERVVVQMNYQYVQPSPSFYLAVSNNEVVVLLEDKKTIYINTGIPLENLPENVQLDIMNMKFIEDEEKLYNFLEAYSS